MKKNMDCEKNFLREVRGVLKDRPRRASIRRKSCGMGNSSFGDYIPLSYFDRVRIQWERERRQLERELRHALEELAKVQKGYLDARRDLDRLPVPPGEVIARIGELRSLLEETRQRLNGEQQDRLKAETLLSEEKRARNQVETWLIQEQEQNRNNKEQIQNLDDRIKELSASNDFHKTSWDEAQARVSQLEEQFEHLKKNNSKLSEQLDQQKSDNSLEVENLREKLEDAQWGRRQAEADRLDMAARLAELHKKKDALSLRLSQLESTHEQTLEKNMHHISQMDEAIRKKNQEIEILKSQIARGKNGIDEAGDSESQENVKSSKNKNLQEE